MENFSYMDLFLGIFSSVFETVVPLLVLWQLCRVRYDLEHLKTLATTGRAPPDKKVLIPGRGFFTVAKEKRKPRAMSDEQIWEKEQNDRTGR